MTYGIQVFDTELIDFISTRFKKYEKNNMIIESYGVRGKFFIKISMERIMS